MNAASVIILVFVVCLAALAAWRCLKKGAPCECGGTCPGACASCSRKSRCCDRR